MKVFYKQNIRGEKSPSREHEMMQTLRSSTRDNAVPKGPLRAAKFSFPNAKHTQHFARAWTYTPHHVTCPDDLDLRSATKADPDRNMSESAFVESL
jgi:hypothetical protein